LGDNLARNVGLDFGTTNSALAILDQGAAPQLAGFPGLSGTAPSFRSILFFDAGEQGPASGVPIAGAESGGNGPLLLSLKSFLADRTFIATDIFFFKYTPDT